MIAVESLILVQQITFGHEATVYIAVFQVDGVLSLVVRIWQLLSCVFTQRALKDEKMTVAENDTATRKGGMSARFPI